MNKINILDKATAELIAAGEVVERPSSVIKELCENCIDAGASKITVEIENGGITYMRVSDNGCGISRIDVPRAFLRHATSKIKNQNDLEAILSLGFRGEALASICSVAKVDMLTKRAEDSVGTLCRMQGGEEVELDDAGCPDGTTIVVRDLFYNTPARMKFLKKNVTEGNAVAEIVERLALSHPEISFRFLRDKKEVIFTPGDSKLLSAIRAVLGREFATELIEMNYTRDGVTVDGFISKPSAARKSRSMQIFFVNGRFVKTQTASAALSRAFEGTLTVGKFPACVLNIKFPAQFTDVNVHPAKTEIRFSNERPIFDAVYYGVKNALMGGDSRPQFDFDAAQQKRAENPFAVKADPTVIPKKVEQTTFGYAASPKNSYVGDGVKNEKPKTSAFVGEKREQPPVKATLPEIDIEADDLSKPLPFEKKRESSEGFVKEPIQKVPVATKPTEIKPVEVKVEEKPIETLQKAEEKISVAEKKTETKPVENKPDPIEEIVEGTPVQMDVRLVGEVFATYIMAEVGDELYLIDKHAAHERILYDRLMNTRGVEPAQLLLLPVHITLRPSEQSALIEHADTLSDMGIIVEDFGGGAVVVRSVPMLFEPSDIKGIVEEIAEALSKGDYIPDDKGKREIFHSIACRAAIKAGDTVSEKDMKALAEAIAKDNSVMYCPHGRPVAIKIQKRDLEKQFKRLQG